MPDMSSSPRQGRLQESLQQRSPGVSATDADSRRESSLGTGTKRCFRFRRFRTARRPLAVEATPDARVVTRLGEGLRGLHVR